jgi:glycerol-3-phosphate cytidylyltransferase-like family protein
MEHETMLQSHKEFIEKSRRIGLAQEVDSFKPYINLIAGYLPNNNEALMRYSVGLQRMTDILCIKQKTEPIAYVYQILASLSALQAVENGYDIVNRKIYNYNNAAVFGEVSIKSDELMTVSDTGKIVEKLRQLNVSTGVVFGHFRLLTPSSLAFLINTFNHADCTLVGVERGDRTIEYKRKDLILSDSERAKIFRSLLPFVFWIEDVPYTNAGYTELLRKINPDIHFGQSDNPEGVKKEMALRAKTVGCKYIEITNLPGASTTEIKQKLDEIDSL